MDNMQLENSLTTPNDWQQYYSQRDYDTIVNAAQSPVLIEDFLSEKTGSIFELGCGQSRCLARAAKLGWEIGGIDFNKEALLPLKKFAGDVGVQNNHLVNGDVFSYDIDSIDKKYDLLVSFGFMEHFRNPAEILTQWKAVLKPGGKVITSIPNLLSINAYFFEKYDPEFWKQHEPFSREQLDSFHISAGLSPVSKSEYIGKFDLHSLIPWDKIETKLANRNLFKLVKYAAYFGVHLPLQLLPAQGIKSVNKNILAVYEV